MKSIECSRLKCLALLVTLLTARVGSAFSVQKTVEAMCRDAGEISLTQLTVSDRKALQLAGKGQDFPVLQLAEDVSKRNTYKKDNNRLVLQLICHGVFPAPAERDAAVEDAYHHWQSGQHFLFNICNYVTSGLTAGFCAQRRAKQDELDHEHVMKNLAHQLTPGQQNAVNEAFKAARNFYTEKADKEEFHGGTIRTASSIDSARIQENRYIARITNTLKGVLPLAFPDDKKADRALNDTWHKVKERLVGKPITDFNMTVSFSGVRDVQRQWLVFRDKTATMLAALNPDITVKKWKALLTQERTEELLRIVNDKG